VTVSPIILPTLPTLKDSPMNQESIQPPDVSVRSLCRVGVENFKQEVLSESLPVLLLCMPEDTSFSAQLSELEKIQLDHQKTLKVCFLEENFLGAFMKRYAVTGTPTLLIFVRGEVRERLLGKFSRWELNQFLQQRLLTDIRSDLF